MIQIANFVVHYDNIYDKIHTFWILFFWWFILNVLWLIFKNFWSKSIDSGKKELILNSRFGHNLKQIYILPKCIYSFNKYFFSLPVLYLHDSAVLEILFLKNPGFQGHIPPQTPLVGASKSLLNVIDQAQIYQYLANKEAYIWT